MPWRYCLKWLLAVDTRLRLILAQKAHQGPVNDCATLRPLLDEVVQSNSIESVLADAEFDSERNHRHIREQIGAESIIPAKRGKPSWKLRGVRAQMRAAFPAERYRQRGHAETVFSAIKRKLSAKDCFSMDALSIALCGESASMLKQSLARSNANSRHG